MKELVGGAAAGTTGRGRLWTTGSDSGRGTHRTETEQAQAAGENPASDCGPSIRAMDLDSVRLVDTRIKS